MAINVSKVPIFLVFILTMLLYYGKCNGFLSAKALLFTRNSNQVITSQSAYIVFDECEANETFWSSKKDEFLYKKVNYLEEQLHALQENLFQLTNQKVISHGVTNKFNNDHCKILRNMVNTKLIHFNEFNES